MTETKKKKSSREKRILIAALLTAAVMVAGSTFAWFTSKDEVTNRLSASANYGVSIAEDFQAPADWVPGQTINKDVSAVNTGNVDAFVRMWLGGQMRVVNENTPSVDAATGTPTAELNKVTDTDKEILGLTYSDGTTYYKTLTTEKMDNPQDPQHPSQSDEDSNNPAQFSEVQSVQAGGVLVYAPADAGYHWTLEQATDLPVYDTTVTPNSKITNLPKGTVVGNSITGETGATKLAPYSTSDSNFYGAIDASTFTPETTGLYIFRRNVSETADGTANKYEYSGYYYDAEKDVYFALHTAAGANGNSDYVLPAGVINDNSTATPSKDQVLPVTIAENQKVYLYTASEKVVDTGTADTNLIWVYDSTNKKFTVTYKGNETDDAKTDDDIVIDIALANIGTASENWTAMSGAPANHLTTFYYNNDVQAGDTTAKLVDSVLLSGDTKNQAYIAFDFDLNVFMESVQVTKDDTGKELVTSVDPWEATGTSAVNTGAKGARDDGSAEIETITWSAHSNS